MRVGALTRDGGAHRSGSGSARLPRCVSTTSVDCTTMAILDSAEDGDVLRGSGGEVLRAAIGDTGATFCPCNDSHPFTGPAPPGR